MVTSKELIIIIFEAKQRVIDAEQELLDAQLKLESLLKDTYGDTTGN